MPMPIGLLRQFKLRPDVEQAIAERIGVSLDIMECSAQSVANTAAFVIGNLPVEPANMHGLLLVAIKELLADIVDVPVSERLWRDAP